ncbi:MAG: toll/interleukin-1 receptor domain-containing protein [Desulfobacterales bacterium]|nr:toll/interleukin-1 receptor domain-containing protein [Desulfobacterales bacterium]
MGEVILYHGAGAQDFEVLGPSWETAESSRLLFNVKRLLTVRGQTDAVLLLDSLPFVISPATNHFNDDFHVLHAQLPLLEYEAVRISQGEKRHAAAQIAKAISEANGPYIRFVAVGLALADIEEWDVFVCHASEDKTEIARPLCSHLESCGIRCWLDEAEIAWGESIVSKIQEGISRARFVLVILTSRFLQKPWPQKELRTALTFDVESERSTILPLLVGEPQSLLSSIPFLKEKRYLSWNGDPAVVERELRKLIRRQNRQLA